MATATDKKEKKASNKTTEASGMAYSPEALMSLLAQQNIKKPDEWKPSVINYQASGVPSVQTQLAGTQHYDTTGNQFVAPSYEHLRDLSIKKDLQGKQDKSKWENVEDTLAGLDVGDNPTHQQAAKNIREAVANHTENLRQGVWGFNTDAVNDFTKDVVTNKGLGQLLSVKAQQAEAMAKINALNGEYDPVEGGGIAPEDLAYNLANAGTISDAQFDENNNMIGTLSFRANPVFEHRNLPKEVDDTVSKMMASAMPERDGDGNIVSYRVLDNQYGITTRESVTKEDIAAKVESYMYNNGGHDYLKHKAKVAAFNGRGTDVEGLREMIDAGLEREGGKSMYGKLYNMTDEEVVENANSILAADAYVKMQSKLLNGAIAAGAYDKDTITMFSDETALARLRGKSGSGEGGDLGVPKYYVSSNISEAVEAINPDGAMGIYQTIEKLDQTIAATEVEVANLEKGGKTDNAYYSQAKAKLQGAKDHKKSIANEINGTVNGYNAYTKSIGEPGFEDIYREYAATNPKDLKDKDFIFQKITAAIAAETDSDSKTTAANILNAAGLGTILSSNKTGIGKFNNVQVNQGTSFTMGTTSSTFETSDNNLIKYAQSVGKTIRNANDKNSKATIGSDGKLSLLPSPTMQYQITTIMPIRGASDKDQEATHVNNILKEVSEVNLNRLEQLTMHDPMGGQGTSVSLDLEKKYKITAAIKDQVFDFAASSIAPTTTQVYGKDGQIAYNMSLKLRPITDSMPKEVKKAIQRIQADIGFNSVYETRIGLGANQKTTDEAIGAAYKALYIRGSLDKTQTPVVIQQQMALTYGNTTGLNAEIDKAGMNRIDISNPAKDNFVSLKAQGKDFKIHAFTADKKTRMFTMEMGDAGYLGYNENGEAGYYTQAQYNASKKMEKKVFNNDLEVKAFLNMAILDEMAAEIPQKGGGGRGYSNSGGERVSFDRSSAKTYQTEVIVNGVRRVDTAYVAQEDLQDISNSGIKFGASIGIPMIHKDVANTAIGMAKEYGLTVSGGLRTKQHSAKGSAENSRHYVGYSLDFKRDDKSIALYDKLKNNPKLQREMGLGQVLMHDAGTGNHLHLEFLPKGKGGVEGSSEWGNKIMAAIGQGESGGNANIGDHYKDKQANSSAHGKYGFTDFWYDKMAVYYGKPVSEIKNNPKLVDKYAKTQYLEEAKNEINPIFEKAKTRLKKFKPDFDKTDAMLVYHYAGGEFLRDLANGKRSLYEVPRRDKGNKLTIMQYINDKRKYI